MKQTFSIQEPVGAGETNRAHDLEATRNALAERRLCRRSVTGQTSATYRPDLAAGIRIFQRQVGLEPDGRLTPGGPTAMTLAERAGAAGPGMPMESKLADARTCAELRNKIDDAVVQISSMSEDIRALERQRATLERELSQIIGALGQLAGRLDLAIDPSPRNLNAVSRELSNLPNDRDVQQAQALVRDARDKIGEIEGKDEEIAFTEDQRHKAEQRLKGWMESFRIGCVSPAPTLRV